MAKKYRMGGRFHKALNAIRVALNTDSKFAEAYNEKGLVHRKLGESGAAIKAYQKAFRLKPKSAPIALNLGNCYLYEENEKQAEIYFKKAVQLGPRYGYAHFNLGALYFEQGKYPVAVKHLEKSIQYDPAFLGAYEICAIACLMLKETQKAEKIQRKAEKIKRVARLQYAVG